MSRTTASIPRASICNEESCSPLETLIAVLSDPPVTIHIDKAMVDVTAEDVQVAFP